MLLLAISVNFVLLGWMVPVAAVAFLLGLRIRSFQLAKAKKRIAELEKELLTGYADVLTLQKEKAQLEQKILEISIPVIPISAGKEEKKSDPANDRGARGKAAQEKS